MGRRPKTLPDGTIRLLLYRAGDEDKRGRGMFALISPEDWKLAAIRWRPLFQPSGDVYAYASVNLGIAHPQRFIYLHREVARAADGRDVDHRNGDTLDCRRGNLRLADAVRNARNTRVDRKNNTSGFKGVGLTPSGRWRASYVVGGRQITIGRFPTAIAAAHAYDRAARQTFGRFARLNFPRRKS